MKLIHPFDVSVEHDAKAHAEEVYPEEACGIVVDNKYVPVENCYSDKENGFLINSSVFVDTEVQAIIHSHPDGIPVPSEADMKYQIDTDMPWGISSIQKDLDGSFTHSQMLWFGDQLPRYPLLERPFIHGITDCYSLIRDVYSEELGIKLLDFPRNWGWWKDNQNLYKEGFAKTGFREISQRELKKYDVIISSLAVRAGIPNHGSVYYGDELVIHHIAASDPIDYSRLSAIVPAAPYFRRAIFYLRHKDCD